MAAPKGNKFAKGNKGGTGRPPVYKSADEMQKRIDSYFNENKIWTIPGLAYHLGFADRQSLSDYEVKQEFCFAIKRAKLMIEDFNAQALHREKGNTAGIIFTLKNLGWKDATDFDINIDFEKLSDEQLTVITNNLFK